MELYKVFWVDVLQKKKFYLPILFFSIVAYSFSLYNRTISYDDLLGDYYYNVMLSGRWGMVAWQELLGTKELDPFIDRFLALCFYLLNSILLCLLIFSIDKNRNVLSYALFASAFVTYPLINEIWEYVGANFVLTGGLCLSTVAAIVVRNCGRLNFKCLLFTSAALLLPVSSYESSAFYYLALICMIIFYEEILRIGNPVSFKSWIRKVILYVFPFFLAILLRFLISYFLNLVNGLTYSGGGATGIGWLSEDYPVVPMVASMVAHNLINYFLAALIYFPIFIFLLSLLVFVIYVLMQKRTSVIILGFIFVLSLFSQSFVQGTGLPYRTAQTITLFVAFVFYLIYVNSERLHYLIRYGVWVVLFGLCWHQAVYLNRILCLNNLRSDNEINAIRQLGQRITSEYDNKPVVFVSPYNVSNWVKKQITVSESTWNGKLFYYVHDIIKRTKKPYKYIDSNVNCATGEYPQIEKLFDYCGYDIKVIKPRPFPADIEYNRKDLETLKEAISITKKRKMKPFQIYDNGDYLIVRLNGLFYKNGYVDEEKYQ